MSTLSEMHDELAVDYSLSAIRRRYWIDLTVSLGAIALFAWLASSGQYAGKSVYSCLMMLNVLYLSSQLRLSRRITLLSQSFGLRAGVVPATTPQQDSCP